MVNTNFICSADSDQKLELSEGPQDVSINMNMSGLELIYINQMNT